MFETVPIMILNILLWFDVFSLDELDGFANLIEIAIISSAFKIVKELIVLYD